MGDSYESWDYRECKDPGNTRSVTRRTKSKENVRGRHCIFLGTENTTEEHQRGAFLISWESNFCDECLKNRKFEDSTLG